MRFSICLENLVDARKANPDRPGYCYTHDALLTLLADGMGPSSGRSGSHYCHATLDSAVSGWAMRHLQKPAQCLKDGIFFPLVRNALLSGSQQHAGYAAYHAGGPPGAAWWRAVGSAAARGFTGSGVARSHGAPATARGSKR